MKIIEFKMYLDGGTIEVKTEFLSYCFDGRMRSLTKDRLFIVQKMDNSNLVTDDDIKLI